MHFYLRISLLVAIALVAKCSEDLETHREEKGSKKSLMEVKEISQGYVTLRDGRRIKSRNGARANFGILDSLFDIIDFESGICSTGTCMSQKDCTNMNGTDTGARCVEGFGVCCVTDGSDGYEGGDVTIGEGGGDFFNPTALDGARPPVTRNVQTRQEEPAEDIKVVYTAIMAPPAGTVQIKMVINSLNLLGPDEGDCINDTLVINGANPGLEIPVLCGLASDQTLYIDIDNSEGPYTIVTSLKCCIDAPAIWNIYVDYLTEADAVERRCLQYHTATEGTIESFNYLADPPGMMLNDQTYSICFGYVVGYCDIVFNFARLDLGRLDGSCTYNYLLIGDDQKCGDFNVENLPPIIANATGPINIGVRSGSVNEIEEEGFSATYMMMRC